jgi:hypothetical protein
MGELQAGPLIAEDEVVGPGNGRQLSISDI